MESVIGKPVMFEAVSSEPEARETRNKNISFYPGHVTPELTGGYGEPYIHHPLAASAIDEPQALHPEA